MSAHATTPKDAASDPRAARIALLATHERALLALAQTHVSRGTVAPFVVVFADGRDRMGAELLALHAMTGAEPSDYLVMSRSGFGQVLDAFDSEAAAGFHEAQGVSFAAIVAHGGVTLQPLTTPALRPSAPWGVN